jgi:ABC-2 type transport system permease protein
MPRGTLRTHDQLKLSDIDLGATPTQAMPGWLQPVAEWNPMSSLAAACRSLFGNPNPAVLVHAWPAQHPELAVVCWSLGLLVVFAPLAVRLYGNKVH